MKITLGTRRAKALLAAATVATLGVTATQSRAATYNWTQTDTSATTVGVTYSWTGLSWDLQPAYPGTVTPTGDVANLAVGTGPNRLFVNMGGGTYTLSALSFGSTSTGSQVIGASNGDGTINFVNGAVLTHNTGKNVQGNATTGNLADWFKPLITFDTSLTIDNSLRFNLRGNSITGNGTIHKTGAGIVYDDSDSANFTGLLSIEAGNFSMAGNGFNKTVTSDITTSGLGVLQNVGSELAGANILVTNNGASWNMGNAAQTIGALAGTSPVINGDGLVLAGSQNTTFTGTIDSVDADIDVHDSGGVDPLVHYNALLKSGSGIQQLGGTSANSITGTTKVTGGRLEFAKTAGLNAISGPLVIDGTAGSAEVRLINSNQIDDASVMTLQGGGKFNANGQSETVSTLTLAAGASAIDMGSTPGSILHFADSSALAASWLGTAQILDWVGNLAGGGTDQLYIGAGATLTGGQLADLTFVNPNSLGVNYTAIQLGTGEIVPGSPVPEPATLGLLSLGGLLMLRRRRA